MIHEVDEALRGLLTGSGLEASGVEIVFDAPTRDWAARRNAPTVCVFLYDIQEDTTRRAGGAGEVYDEDGLVVARRAPPRWFALTYLVTAWAGRPQDEHRLLSRVLAALVTVDAFPERLLTGSLAELGLAVRVETAGAGQGSPAVSDVWSALGGEMRASLAVRVRAPLAGVSTAAGPPVTEGLLVRASGPEPDGGTAPGRRLRYEGIDDPGREGFAGPRGRRAGPARRRRGGSQP